ncbi:hypothetical protein D0T25_24355 [Duganella sp. BJB488]|uniref:pectate lyase n=1 Tax=unclassified Duganella TaxID=2636909 RepID=UPI000E340DF4|nr:MULTISPECIES: pectate lyase [unclassified Duganella]RFP09322.1 hypothetical protein D0T23_26830 [Duganella sp. BJB475]RFP13210.1 hypothetical protein D0T26_23265 [Duganella sp. BJB489]RFP17215.1 hypothetical protein D0T25_24355 [Duganella sp. BJB488]RFP25358.1 hypothetical protein D0T21_27860 [Duganella sp. BJB476]RFP31565.1 hypothetical protein D0T24_24360 [Duganella sp. BJB480]
MSSKLALKNVMAVQMHEGGMDSCKQQAGSHAERVRVAMHSTESLLPKLLRASKASTADTHHHQQHHHHHHHKHHKHHHADAQHHHLHVPQDSHVAHPAMHMALPPAAVQPVEHASHLSVAAAVAAPAALTLAAVGHAPAPAASPVAILQSSGSTAVSKPMEGKAMEEPTGVVDVSKTIVVHAGEVFDGHGQYFRPTSALGDGGVSEFQKPVIIVAPGGEVKNLQYSGADGIHLLGDAKLDHVTNRDVGEDAITIDGGGTTAYDAQLAGIDLATIPQRPAKVEIDNSSFYHAHDKVIQTNGDADVTLKGMYTEDVGQVMVTNGGHPITAHVTMADSTFKDTKYDVFRADSRTSTLSLSNVDTGNAPLVAMMGDTSHVTGTTSVRPSIDPV